MPYERRPSRINTQTGESFLGSLVQSLFPEVRRASSVFLSTAARSRFNQPIQEWSGYCLTGRVLDVDSYDIHRTLTPDNARTWRLLIAAQDKGVPYEILSPPGTAEARVKIWRAERAIQPHKLIVKHSERCKLKEIE